MCLNFLIFLLDEQKILYKENRRRDEEKYCIGIAFTDRVCKPKRNPSQRSDK